MGARLDPAVRRQQILDAAIAYFAEAGFGVQTRELARRLGISQPLLYRYFPSKDDLIRAVFDVVFMRRWDDQWSVRLRDRSVALEQRLFEFYVQYAAATYKPEWIRIYMYAGLGDLDLNRKYLQLVRTRLLTAMCEEFRHAFVPARQRARLPKVTPREIELAWTLHGSMFYWAVRQNIFHVRTPLPFDQRARDAIMVFLAGMRETYPLIVAQLSSEQ